MNIKGIFSKIFKGDQGELSVLESINKILNDKSEGSNYYLLPKVCLDDPAGGTKEIDLVLLHPALGLYVIEVKNWSNFDLINEKNPYTQAKTYQKMLFEKIEKALGKTPVNIEFRVIFPSLSKDDGEKFYRQNPNFAAFANHTFFKDDLSEKDIFARFFNSSVNAVPNKKEFIKISELLINQKSIQKNKVIPIITNKEIMFLTKSS